VDMWGAMVESDGFADSIIQKFDLMNRHKSTRLVLARKRYVDVLDVDIGGEGILAISYEDKDPQFAADVTNEVVDLLDRTLQRIHATSAGRTREFIEERLADTEIELRQAEDNLAKFQKSNRAVALEDQARVAVENMAQLYAQLSIIEVQSGAAKHSGAYYSPERGQLESQATELRRKINQLEQKGDTLLLGIPIRKYPDLILEYARLYRDLTIQEIVYEMLRQQYEQARIEEQRNTKKLHILTRATPPDKKTRPKRAKMAIAAAFGVGVIVFLSAQWRGYLNKLQALAPQEYERVVGLWRKRKERN